MLGVEHQFKLFPVFERFWSFETISTRYRQMLRQSGMYPKGRRIERWRRLTYLSFFCCLVVVFCSCSDRIDTRVRTLYELQETHREWLLDHDPVAQEACALEGAELKWGALRRPESSNAHIDLVPSFDLTVPFDGTHALYGNFYLLIDKKNQPTEVRHGAFFLVDVGGSTRQREGNAWKRTYPTRHLSLDSFSSLVRSLGRVNPPTLSADTALGREDALIVPADHDPFIRFLPD